ncbi:hypothetical protein HUJ05_012536 [Dendroctonus ponderosae]|nr:hypothetical protein HUJ05_012536 [Dendroctonus ponderosae]
MELDDTTFDYGVDDQNFYDSPPFKKGALRRVTFNPKIYSKDEDFVFKQEIIDESSDEDQTQMQTIGSIQKVPSISDLSDPEASLGVWLEKSNGPDQCSSDITPRSDRETY